MSGTHGDEFDIACRELVEIVTDYLEGALEPAMTAAVERHLVLCPHCEVYIEQMRETDPVGLRHEPEQCTVPVKAPGPTFLDDLEAGLVVAIQELVGNSAGGVLVGQLERLGPEPLHADHRDEAIW